MKDSLAVPADEIPVHHAAWDTRIQQVAALATSLCREKDAVHSAVCSISGPPDKLIVNFACAARAEAHVPMLMLYVNDTLLPSMEKSLGIQFEVRNLQFTVTGRKIQAPASAGLEDSVQTTDWLDLPFAEPAAAAGTGHGGARTDLTLF